MVWIKFESELRHFMNEINQKHQSIKFYFKFSKESIEFLDTLVYIDSKNRLHITRSYLKKVFRIVRHSELSAHVQSSRNTGNIPKT